MCQYHVGKVKNGPPSEGCIIGQAIKAVDPDLFDTRFAGISASVTAILGNGFVSVEGRRILMWLESVQRGQDNDCTWSQAVKGANEST